MDISIIKHLREKTGASVADCKTCLEDADGNMQKAIELLRKRGAEIAQKKSSRETTEGTIGSYVHTNGKIAALVAIKCETDFVARNTEFQSLAKDIAMHAAALSPEYIKPEDVPHEAVEKEKEIEREKLQKEGKPEQKISTILEGKMNKFYERVCLLKQLFVKDDKKTIESLIQEKIQKLGENIEIAQYVRMEL